MTTVADVNFSMHWNLLDLRAKGQKTQLTPTLQASAGHVCRGISNKYCI